MKAIAIFLLVSCCLSGIFLKKYNTSLIPDIKRINCISYDPNYKVKFNPKSPTQILKSSIEEDLLFLSHYTKCIRLYTSRFGHELVPQIAQKYNMEVVAGAWLTDFHDYENEKEIEAVIKLSNANFNIKKIIIGNEVVEMKLTTIEKLVKSIQLVKSKTNKKVSTTVLSPILLERYNELKPVTDSVDFIAVHILPYWFHVKKEEYLSWVTNQYESVTKLFPHKEVFVAEVGFPSRGQANLYGNEMSRYLQAKSLREVISSFNEKKIDYNIIGAFDQPWQRFEYGGLANVFFGIFTIYKAHKFQFSGPIPYVDISNIYIYLHIFLTIILYLAIRKKITTSGQIYTLLAFHFIYISFCMMLDYYLTSYPYLSFGHFFFVSNLMVYLILTVFHTYEFIFRFFLINEKQDAPLAIISTEKLNLLVIIPFTNEPIDIIQRSLNSIKLQTYNNFQVLLVANNYQRIDFEEINSLITSHPHCTLITLGNIAGGKAGAINKAILNYKKEYDVLVILDCDYQVKTNWLEHVNQNISDKYPILFYPQAYERTNSNLITELIENEYSGYSKFSLPLRFKKNIGIVHGAMLCIKKEIFFKYKLLNEKTITEDADFGVKAVIGGEHVKYVEEIFGKGVFPSSFKAYLNQRERWVVGACQVMFQNFTDIIYSKKISFSQKIYLFLNWIPWIVTLPYLIFIAYQLYYYDRILFRYHYMDGVYYFLPFPCLFIFMMILFTFVKKHTLNTGVTKAFLTCLSSLCLVRIISLSVLRFVLPFFKLPFKVTTKNNRIKEFTPFGIFFNLSVAFACLFYAYRFINNFQTYSFQIYLQLLIMIIIFTISFSEIIISLFYTKSVNEISEVRLSHDS